MSRSPNLRATRNRIFAGLRSAGPIPSALASAWHLSRKFTINSNGSITRLAYGLDLSRYLVVEMAEPRVTLTCVDDCIKGRHLHATAFPTEIEEQFEVSRLARRCKRLSASLVISALLYNLFLVAELLLLPDVFWLCIALHLLVVTPWMLAAAWAISKAPAPILRESLAASIPVLMVLQIDVCLALTTSSGATHYQYLAIPILLYTNVSLHRLDYRFARIVTVLILVLHCGFVLAVNPSALAATVIAQVTICAYTTLVANYMMERDLRRSFLSSLRDRLLRVEADAISRLDPLTGLYNRLRLEEELTRLWSRAEHEAPISVLMVDIDFFKLLNDGYGHSAGDACLRRVSAVFRSDNKYYSDAFRYGGEEFLLLLPGVEMPDAIRFADSIRKAIEDERIPNERSPLNGIVTASFGIATSTAALIEPSGLVAAADLALYAAKKNGRNQVWPKLATSRPLGLLQEVAGRYSR